MFQQADTTALFEIHPSSCFGVLFGEKKEKKPL
jgi:hypothetical protein